MAERKKKIIVAVSGGFDPVHPGHLRLFAEAKKLGDKLIIILNNDNWLKKKKGFIFMSQKKRKELLEGFRVVDKVYLTTHRQNPKDMSVCKELEKFRPDVFANGGDRIATNIPEYILCKKLGIKMVFSVGGKKVQSSSNLIKRIIKLHADNQS